MGQERSSYGLDRIDPQKRATLRKLAAGAVFAAPVVLSFPLGSLAITDVRAYVNPTDQQVEFPPIPGDTADGLAGGQPPQGNPPSPRRKPGAR